MSRYFVDVETDKGNIITLTTHLFDEYKKADRYYKQSKKKDNKYRYTYSVAIRSF